MEAKLEILHSSSCLLSLTLETCLSHVEVDSRRYQERGIGVEYLRCDQDVQDNTKRAVDVK